ncbi:hypothetical protein [Shinella sp. HZN7]|uniref:hypothetical protein n=1 Tax=Shinella sp. (strain HZN7) TaxID=879274 RepID=UPI0011AB4479|nr:hypothetical protein [Shinella sp. HZN7]
MHIRYVLKSRLALWRWKSTFSTSFFRGGATKRTQLFLRPSDNERAPDFTVYIHALPGSDLPEAACRPKAVTGEMGKNMGA